LNIKAVNTGESGKKQFKSAYPECCKKNRRERMLLQPRSRQNVLLLHENNKCFAQKFLLHFHGFAGGS
jgi:hypothetical protein